MLIEIHQENSKPHREKKDADHPKIINETVRFKETNYYLRLANTTYLNTSVTKSGFWGSLLDCLRAQIVDGIDERGAF